MEVRGDSKAHAVLLSSPGFGHLIPVIDLGKRLVTVLNFKVTIFVVASQTSAVQSQILESSMTPAEQFEIIELPPPDISHLVGAAAAVVTQIAVLMREIKQVFSSAVSALKSPPTVLIVDFFGFESLDIADKFNIPRLVYVPSHAWFLALTIYLPRLDEVVKGEYVDEKEALFIPGCKSVRPEDVVDPMMCRSDQQYLEYVKMGIGIPTADGILVNIWEDLDPTTLTALRDNNLLGHFTKVPIYPIGPMVRPTKPVLESDKEIFNWLDKQPSGSVVFVSFGSGGMLSKEQTKELAWGLELSQQRFIWVVRTPALKSGDGSYFTVGSGTSHSNIASYLPEGFLDRTKNLGLVVSDWAPQVEILSHGSIGGFFSHCGWNSTLESIINGVPLIAWPLYAEQKMNATMLAEELRIAVRSKTSPSKEIVGREEIEMMVRKIMMDDEGHRMRGRVKELKLTAENAWTTNGSSSKALAQAMC